MSGTSAIEWTDATWNPVTGCTQVSPGCAHCYALELAGRLRAMGNAKYVLANDGGKGSGPAFGVTLHPGVLHQPLRWRKPRRVFVNSMSDLFHEDIPDEYIADVFAVMAAAPQHTFQVLTKRPERMREVLRSSWFALSWLASAKTLGAFDHLDRWPIPNVWLGVSIENRRFVDRADLLRDTPAAVRFISAEPMLGPLIPELYGRYSTHWWADADGNIVPIWVDGHKGNGLNLADIDWLIVGGESGANHRPIRPSWVRDLRDACRQLWRCTHCDADVEREDLPHLPVSTEGGRLGLRCPVCGQSHGLRPRTAFFFKQWGGRTPKAGGRELDGRTWDEFPATRTTA